MRGKQGGQAAVPTSGRLVRGRAASNPSPYCPCGRTVVVSPNGLEGALPYEGGIPAMSADHDEEVATNGELREGANVEKIRDILFGSNMREYEKRFARLEDRLTKSSEALREDLKTRFDSLESYVREEMESLNQRLKSEKSERSDSLRDLTRETRDSSKFLEKKIAQLEELLASAQGDLRSRILEQSKSLSNQIQQSKDDLESSLQREADTLRADKTDRAMLADMFTELAMRLKDELELPGT